MGNGSSTENSGTTICIVLAVVALLNYRCCRMLYERKIQKYWDQEEKG